jgi:hypothetical protein
MVVELNEFESPGQEEVEITIRGKSAKYLIREVSGAKINDLFAPLRNATTPEKKDKAARESIAKVIAACVSRADGTAFTEEDAGKLRFSLQQALQKHVMEINGLTPDADEAAKKG